jgi:uncharacterized protein YndB with AHSA1/START domain
MFFQGIEVQLRRKLMTTITKFKHARRTTDPTLVLTRVFNAPQEMVFKAWTQPEHVMQWWGPKDFTCPVCEIDLRPGGVYFNCMRSPEGRDFWSRGIYREIVQPRRIVCRDSFADEKGNKVSPQQYGMSSEWPEETLITLTFNEHDGKTRIMLHHSPIKPGSERDMCRQGWNESLDKLADYLTGVQKKT